MPIVELHDLAWDELDDARRHYFLNAGQVVLDRFVEAFKVASHEIELRPRSLAPYLLGTRFSRVKRFPYILVFQEIDPNFMLVLAVAHLKRRPGYWRSGFGSDRTRRPTLGYHRDGGAT